MLRRTFLGTALLAGAAAPLMAQASAAAGDAAAVVAEVARQLERGYLIPATGKRYAAMLRERLAAGAYTGITDPATLGSRLTADLQMVAPDRHLRIVKAEPPRAPAAQGATPAGPPRAPGLQDAGWIADGVAYLRYVSWTDPANVAATEAFMRSHAGARTLVIDCRYNNGGGMDEMNVILPYLFARETRLVAFEMVEAIAADQGSPFDGPSVRRVAAVTPGTVRWEHVAIPRADEQRWRTAKVFYLISGRTGSAAEHMALAMKHSGRAVLIGEPTGGANHFGGFEPVGWGLALFLPVGRTVDLTTGEDWEVHGVAPDVATAPLAALQEALRRAGVTVPG